jgi:hypothetical protein
LLLLWSALRALASATVTDSGRSWLWSRAGWLTGLVLLNQVARGRWGLLVGR